MVCRQAHNIFFYFLVQFLVAVVPHACGMGDSQWREHNGGGNTRHCRPFSMGISTTTTCLIYSSELNIKITSGSSWRIQTWYAAEVLEVIHTLRLLECRQNPSPQNLGWGSHSLAWTLKEKPKPWVYRIHSKPHFPDKDAMHARDCSIKLGFFAKSYVGNFHFQNKLIFKSNFIILPYRE